MLGSDKKLHPTLPRDCNDKIKKSPFFSYLTSVTIFTRDCVWRELARQDGGRRDFGKVRSCIDFSLAMARICTSWWELVRNGETKRGPTQKNCDFCLANDSPSRTNSNFLLAGVLAWEKTSPQGWPFVLNTLNAWSKRAVSVTLCSLGAVIRMVSSLLNLMGSPPSWTKVPYPVGVKKAGIPAPPARMRSARVPCNQTGNH